MIQHVPPPAQPSSDPARSNAAKLARLKELQALACRIDPADGRTWPITESRIRAFLSGWEVTPEKDRPFSVRCLMACMEALRSAEMEQGMEVWRLFPSDPPDAPWLPYVPNPAEPTHAPTSAVPAPPTTQEEDVW